MLCLKNQKRYDFLENDIIQYNNADGDVDSGCLGIGA